MTYIDRLASPEFAPKLDVDLKSDFRDDVDRLPPLKSLPQNHLKKETKNT